MRKNTIPWIYLDNNATTKIDSEVFNKTALFSNQWYGNPSSMHQFGNVVDQEICKAREKTADLLHTDPERFIFTSGATESNASVFHAISELYPEKKHIITSAVEHPAVLNNCQYLEKKKGYTVTYLPVDRNGMLNPKDLRQSIREDTALISIMWANNETGVIFPIARLADIAREKGVLFHTDAVQAVGKIPIDLKTLPVDFLSLSAHKFHGPKGTGALYVHSRAPFHPLLTGGHQEQGRRAGTLNSPGIIGMGEACRLASEHLQKKTYERLGTLRDKFETSLRESIPHISVHGEKSPRLPNTSNIGFKYIEGESITILLSENHIAVSTGSACTSESLQPSHVLQEMQVPHDEMHGSIRFSLSRFTTEQELNKTTDILQPAITTLRKLSPLSPSDE